MSLRCLFGFHHRSRRHALDYGHRLVSKCARCGIPMEKDGQGRWVVYRTDRERASASE
jgi:hypothetical protein